ncbi:MAG: carbon starvation protein A [Armatimonadota bacterium]|nr:carbon starvation protein A [bacterium]
MHAISLLIIASLVFALAYRYISAFLAARVLALDATRPTPAEVFNDEHDFAPTNRWMLLGHHFAAISGAGPLIGPVLAAQFGYAPGFIWMLVGAVVAGAVHDMIVLYASTRHDGKSLVGVARSELGPISGWLISVFMLFLLIITMAGASIAIVNALYKSPWGTFTVAATIPISIFIGIYLRWLRPGKIGEATAIGVSLIIAGVIGGAWIEHSFLGQWLNLSKEHLSLAIPIYGFLAAGLPVWLLLLPRDYLSSYIKVGTMLLLVVGMLVANPVIKMPAFTPFVNGGGPIIPGTVWPFLFITISCGALSGYHSIVCCGTTPKMVASETDIRMIGYGSMLIESIVAMTALIAVTVLPQGDFFAISTTPDVFRNMGMHMSQLPALSHATGEQLAGRPGGAATLAAGMANLFSGIGGRTHLMGFWYHFAIAFQALFILTLIDAGTRAGRYLLQEIGGTFYAPMKNTTWLPGVMLTSGLVCGGWGYLLYGGSISTIWPLFGVNNQMLGAISLTICTTILIKMGKRKYSWITLSSMLFLLVTSIAAGIANIRRYMHDGNTLLTVISVLLLIVGLLIIVDSVRQWKSLLSTQVESDIEEEALIKVA